MLLAFSSVVAGEARANTGVVVTDTTSRAVTTLISAISTHNIGVRGAFTEGAVRSTESNVADASLLLQSVPRGDIFFTSFSSKLLRSHTDSTVIAVIRADGTLASVTFVVVVALAQTSLAVTGSLVGAFCAFVAAVVDGSYRHPRLTHRTCALRAVSAGPCSIRVV